jgi:hypothetical protein
VGDALVDGAAKAVADSTNNDTVDENHMIETAPRVASHRNRSFSSSNPSILMFEVILLISVINNRG